jgi:hypothetical protein
MMQSLFADLSYIFYLPHMKYGRKELVSCKEKCFFLSRIFTFTFYFPYLDREHNYFDTTLSNLWSQISLEKQISYFELYLDILHRTQFKKKISIFF